MKQLFIIALASVFLACTSPATTSDNLPIDISITNDDSLSAVELHYNKWSGESAPSRSEGTVGSGKLINGRIMPFSGTNFRYFDTTSYLANRAFVHERVKTVVLDTYKQLEEVVPGRQLILMECSNREGGKIAPHHTHQNGLSIDFMTPLIKDGKPCYELDDLGPAHYLLNFDDEGRYLSDTSVSIDFELLAQHVLQLIKSGKKSGVGIEKVILKLALKDNLFATPAGKALKESGVYFATKLPSLIDNLHDDHFHVDFKLAK